MSGAYEIRVDENDRILYIKLVGYLDIATARRFVDEVKAAVRKLAAAGPGWKMLSNQEKMETNSREVMELLSSVGPYLQASGLAKGAVYTPGALNRMQMKRAALDELFRTFASEGEARAWLDE
jgi:hypothetical protein